MPRGGGICRNLPPLVSALNIFFLLKFLNFEQIQKSFERISYNVLYEILTHIFDISSKIRPYNVTDFDLDFVLIMFEILTQMFDISTKIRDILNKTFNNLTKIFEIFIKILYSLTQIFEFLTKRLNILQNV